MKENKVFIFGAGDNGREIYSKLSHKFKIIGFLDNDLNKTDYRIDSLNILSPNMLNSFEYDFIIIASTYENDIINQLKALKVSENKIIKASSLKSDYYFPWGSIILLIIIFSAISLTLFITILAII
jgi:FlaA1/EpsC-like NDP-sugar epimerase